MTPIRIDFIMPKHDFPLPSGALTVPEAADYLRISPATVWRLLRNKMLSRARIGGRVVIRRIDLDAFLAKAVDAA
jgi:excisionase family DNA binding protein